MFSFYNILCPRLSFTTPYLPYYKCKNYNSLRVYKGKNMNRNELYQMIVNRTIQCFTPTEHELHMIENRLKQYSNEELKHLEANFTTFGVDAILECMYSAVV